jgi:putative membrane protein
MNTYLLLKSIHLIAVISWMAGLLYLPRIFVYHSEAVANKKSEDLMSTFKVMEKRLFIYITNPAMIASWIFGGLLIHTIGIDNFGSLWLQLKLLFVIILTIYHFFLFQCLRKFAENNNSYSPEFYRIINEIPTVLLIGIILVVVFKPL